MLTILVILAVILTLALAVALVYSMSDGGLFSWFAIDAVIKTAFEVIALLVTCLE